MEFVQGQLLVILVPFLDYEVYANVRQITEETIMLELKSLASVPVNKDILCIAVHGENMFEFYTQVRSKDENRIIINKPIINNLNQIEQRKFNRIDCNIGFVATPLSINRVPLPISDKKFIGVIRNISAGGVLMETNLNLPVGMVASFKLKLNFFLDCKVTVVRTSYEEGSNLYLSGCRFVENNLDTVKMISLYVFKEQLNKKRKELNAECITKGGKNN